MVNNEKVEQVHRLSIPRDGVEDYIVNEKLRNKQMWLVVEGALLPRCYENLSSHSLEIWVQHLIVDDLPNQYENGQLESGNIRQVKVRFSGDGFEHRFLGKRTIQFAL